MHRIDLQHSVRIRRDAIDTAIAANNAAVCELYCCNLSKAVARLESQLRADPVDSLKHPTIVSGMAELI